MRTRATQDRILQIAKEFVRAIPVLSSHEFEDPVEQLRLHLGDILLTAYAIEDDITVDVPSKDDCAMAWRRLAGLQGLLGSMLEEIQKADQHIETVTEALAEEAERRGQSEDEFLEATRSAERVFKSLLEAARKQAESAQEE
jgi:hypothetical protein